MDHSILFAIPFFFLLIFIEYLWSRHKKKEYYRFNDAITNLNIGVGQQITGLFFKLVIVAIYFKIYEHFAFFQIENNVWTFILCLVGFDFLFYWAHRWSHEINFFWGAHVVHHSSEEYNLAVALRQPWFHGAIAFFIFLPLPILGFDPLLILPVAGLHTVYQFWIHTRAIGKLPRWVEWTINTPSHHRVHHARDPKYIDKNHAGVFMIWDRLFGTFMEEEEEPNYGITTPFKSWNPGWANLHYYAEMWQKTKEMNNWRDKVKMIFARPGWLPEYMGGYQAPKAVKTNYKKFDTTSSWWLNSYVLMQFVAISLGTMAFIYHFGEISTFYKFAFLGVLLLSLLICGAIFENRRWVAVAEYARLAIVILSLNTFYYYWYIDWFTVMLVASSIGFVLFAVWFTISWIYGQKDLQAAPVAVNQ